MQSTLRMVAGVFGLINLLCVSLWAGFRVGLRHWLQDPAKLRIFNITIALLLVVSFLPLVADLLQTNPS